MLTLFILLQNKKWQEDLKKPIVKHLKQACSHFEKQQPCIGCCFIKEIILLTHHTTETIHSSKIITIRGTYSSMHAFIMSFKIICF